MMSITDVAFIYNEIQNKSLVEASRASPYKTYTLIVIVVFFLDSNDRKLFRVRNYIKRMEIGMLHRETKPNQHDSSH